MIKVTNLHKYFGELHVLKGINEEIHKGEVVSIIGPSGSGKSTFLRCLNLLEKPEEGQILFEGVDITAKGVDIDKHRQKMGMVFQHFNVFPHKSVLENITLAPILVKKMPKDEAEAMAMDLLGKVGLESKERYYPSQLSGGEKQRAALARAIVNKPVLLLADEPTGNLDHENGEDIMRLLNTINETGTTVLVVSHNRDLVRSMKKREVTLKNGRIIKDSDRGGFLYEL